MDVFIPDKGTLLLSIFIRSSIALPRTASQLMPKMDFVNMEKKCIPYNQQLQLYSRLLPRSSGVKQITKPKLPAPVVAVRKLFELVAAGKRQNPN